MNAVLLSGWRLRAVMLSIIVAVALYLGVMLWAGADEVWRALKLVGVGGVLLALGLSLVNYSLRFTRWQLYLRTLGHAIPTRASLHIYVAGFALTTTPGKAGEALRGVLLKRRRVPYPDSFAAFVSERLSDLIAVVLLSLLGLTLVAQGTWLIAAGAACILAALVILSWRRPLAWIQTISDRPGQRVWRSLHHVATILLQARRCHRPALLAAATALSVIAWSAEALAFWWILNAMGFEAGFAFAAFVFALAMLAGALSFLPGGLGGTEAVMVALLLWADMPPADAIAATMLIRFTTLWFAVILGLIALATNPEARGHEHPVQPHA
ncbi:MULTISPECIES: lysylphosphatidylglycerol synthase transmembrane domain-containing protein [unclassified Thioalkalivibrio]|uniref:lysylphosphatidylglycerol synthase transmembrane domain-containing protein n=1 Tax=unclassified Thioalkalivibrio TaxID=2621013 RepID=UPI000374029F|nr:MULTISPECIES: lysylphosphatidylglycerol synthase transmembrane domain-containing protein [unclassified Thioalkalivibrio]